MGSVPTVTSAAGPGTPKCGPVLLFLLPPARAHARRQPVRLLACARRPAAVLPALLPPDAARARALPRRGAVHHRRQPPLVPRPVRDRDDGPPPRLLRRQEGALRQALAGVVPQLAGRLPDRPRRRRPGRH